MNLMYYQLKQYLDANGIEYTQWKDKESRDVYTAAERAKRDRPPRNELEKIVAAWLIENWPSYLQSERRKYKTRTYKYQPVETSNGAKPNAQALVYTFELIHRFDVRVSPHDSFDAATKLAYEYVNNNFPESASVFSGPHPVRGPGFRLETSTL